MRYDMPEVINESPRGGHHSPNRKSRLRLRGSNLNGLLEKQPDEIDSGPDRMSMSVGCRSGSGNSKEASFLIGPLRRFLHSRVGRHWDMVHSEISHKLDNRTVVRGKYFWDQVYWLVDAECYLGRNGKVYRSKFSSIISPMEVRGFFVHPATGLLCYNQEKRWRVHPTKKFMDRLSKFGFFDIDRSRGFRFESPLHVGQAQRFRIVDELTVLELKPGGWFIHIYVYHNPEEIIEWRECTVGQAQLPGRIPVLRKEKKDWPTRYCLSTRQMGKKEIKKHLAIIARDPI